MGEGRGREERKGEGRERKGKGHEPPPAIWRKLTPMKAIPKKLVKVDKLQTTFKGAEGTKIYSVRRKASLVT